MAIRTAQLAAAAIPAAVDTTIYTVPATKHVRVRLVRATVAGAGMFIVYVLSAGGVAIRILQPVAAAGINVFTADDADVLEAGDTVHVLCAAAQTANVLLSGTVYDN